LEEAVDLSSDRLLMMIRSSARRPTPNLEDRSASLNLGRHLGPVRQGRPYQQQATADIALRIGLLTVLSII
jgi:hypothetical protein